MKDSSECDGLIYDYRDQQTGFIQSVCWKCGYYEDNSPAFSLMPDFFKNLVRENTTYFIRKFAVNRQETRIILPTRKQNHSAICIYTRIVYYKQ